MRGWKLNARAAERTAERARIAKRREDKRRRPKRRTKRVPVVTATTPTTNETRDAIRKALGLSMLIGQDETRQTAETPESESNDAAADRSRGEASPVFPMISSGTAESRGQSRGPRTNVQRGDEREAVEPRASRPLIPPREFDYFARDALREELAYDATRKALDTSPIVVTCSSCSWVSDKVYSEKDALALIEVHGYDEPTHGAFELHGARYGDS